MGSTRFYCESLEGETIHLSACESHHLVSVRRIGKGQKVELFDGAGKLAEAVVEKVDSKKAVLRIEQIKKVPEPKSESQLLPQGRTLP